MPPDLPFVPGSPPPAAPGASTPAAPGDNDAAALQAMTALLGRLSADPEAKASDVAAAIRAWTDLGDRLRAKGDEQSLDLTPLSEPEKRIAEQLGAKLRREVPPFDGATYAKHLRAAAKKHEGDR